MFGSTAVWPESKAEEPGQGIRLMLKENREPLKV